MFLKCSVRRKDGKEHRSWSVVESRRVGRAVLQRPIYHHKSERIEAHLFVAFLAYCLSITLRQRLKALAGGLMPRVIFEKLAMLQLLDVRVPTTDGRELLLVRRTEPDRDVALLLARLNLQLPPQPPPCISQPQAN